MKAIIYGDKGAPPTMEHPLPQIIMNTKKPKPTKFTLLYNLDVTVSGNRGEIWKSRNKLGKEIAKFLQEKYPDKKIEVSIEEMRW
jgi:hypothetical protein